MASLKNVIRQFHDEIVDGIAWVTIYKNGRSWEAEAFWPEDGDYDDGFVFSHEDYEAMQNIASVDPKAICVNGYYMPFGADFTLEEIENKVIYFYEGRMNLLAGDFLGSLVIPQKGDEQVDILKKFGLDTASDPSFFYRMLDRMRSDCEYYLGYGGRHAGHLWAQNEKDHIACMKALWERFPADGKPEWLSYEKILEYEERMSKVEVLFTFGSWEHYPFKNGYVSITASTVDEAIAEFRKHFPDYNEGTLNCSDFCYQTDTVARVKADGLGAGCHKTIDITSSDRTVEELISQATEVSKQKNNDSTQKSDVEYGRE